MYKINIGSLLHDIGRFSCPPGKEIIKHAYLGAEILRKEGLPDIAQIAERHIGAGITKEEIIKRNLPLPHKDFLPLTKEEKIISHVDNLTFGDKEGTFEMVVERFRKELGEKYVARFIRLKEDVDNLMKLKN
jgi:uncharacterized protein